MNEKREILGQWWLPEQPDEKWIGTLTLEPHKSPRLQVTVLKGFFDLLGGKAPPVIHGHDDQGKPITLLFPGWPQTSGGMAMSQMAFTAGYAILGIEVAGPADFVLNTLTLRAQLLYDWLGITGFVREPKNILAGHMVTYRLPEDQSFSINSDLKVHVCPMYLSGGLGASEQSVREDLCLSLESLKGLGLKDCKALMAAVRNLLHFASLKPVYMLSIGGTKEGYGQTHEGKFSPQEIEIWNSIIREKVEPDPRWIFRFSDVRPRFSRFFSEWLDFSAKFHEALGCYTTTVYHRLPSEVELLCVTQALEAYHGIKFQSHKTRGFLVKIRDLSQQFLPHFQGLVPDPMEFASAVRDNRNYYTHHNPIWLKDGRVANGAPLIRLNEKLKLLFQMAVLTEMGIPSDRFAILRRQLATGIVDYL